MERYFCVFILWPTILFSQAGRDSVLLKERSIDRPITLHRGQVRLEGGYTLATITKGFDEDGQVYDLKSSGTSFARHQFYFAFRYGFFQNLTIEVYTDRKSQSIRKEQIITLSSTEGIVEISEIETKKGWENLNLMLVGRLPIRNARLDLIGASGLGLQLGEDQEQRPDHRYSSDPNGATSLHYRFNKKWGNGTSLLQVGSWIKYRWPMMAVTSGVFYALPVTEAKDVRWEYQLKNQVFQYRPVPYQHQSPAIIRYNLEVEYQIAPWFDISVSLSGENSNGGWVKEVDQRYQIPRASLFVLAPGYEIIVTPKVWLRQKINFSLFGESSEAPFSIFTSLVFNDFPILKK